jgi:hypothetical protein
VGHPLATGHRSRPRTIGTKRMSWNHARGLGFGYRSANGAARPGERRRTPRRSRLSPSDGDCPSGSATFGRDAVSRRLPLPRRAQRDVWEGAPRAGGRAVQARGNRRSGAAAARSGAVEVSPRRGGSAVVARPQRRLQRGRRAWRGVGTHPRFQAGRGAFRASPRGSRASPQGRHASIHVRENQPAMR